MKIKNIVIFVISVAVMFAVSILYYSLIEYYDLESVLVVGLPLIIIARFADLSIRDFIAKDRHKQVLIATFITTLVYVSIFIAGYFMYTTVFNHIDIYKNIITALNIPSLSGFVA